MENTSSIYRTVRIWLLLPIVFVSSILFANTSQSLSVHKDNLIFEKSILFSDYFATDSSNGNLPFEIPADNEDNSINDVEDTVKIDVLKGSISYNSTLSLTLKDIPLSYLCFEQLSLHQEITIPPPK
ncbi:hypothetical protein ACFQZF_09590 [Flavobacterium myungsuense]|uniref:Gingipain propeptide domain-containing protein n=1 Tax=Flavobacterium myungsuense TaxID=651823 RepID=A0ABW3J3C1_9FLAO